MSRFKMIPPLDMSEYFVTANERKTFHPNDWNLPLPWISTFIYTHLVAHFWGVDDNNIDNKPKVLQIGCAQGWDAVENAKILKLPMINGELHIIDWFKGNLTVNIEEEWAYNENNPETWKAHLWSEAKKFKVDDIITVFEGDSREQIHNVESNYYDIIFIDGGHEYDIVKSDVENGYNKLKDGGIMVFDDFSGGPDAYEKYDIKNATSEMLKNDTYSFNGELIHCGVVKAVHEFLNGNYIVCGSHDKAYHIKGYKIKRENTL
jgi:hypothetical protein